MKKLWIMLSAVIGLSGCIRLDSFAFDPLNDITSYEMDNYTGDVPFVIPATYNINTSLVTEVVLDSHNADGAVRRIHAIYIGDIAQIAVNKVILYCHGNYGHMDYYWQRAKLLANLGPAQHTYGVMMFDYQGYGLSEGSPSESNLYRDTDAAMAWLKSQGLTNNRLIMYGYSLGSAPATNLTANARSMQPALLILEAPFASGAIMVQDGSGLALPSSYFISLGLNNADEILKVTEPFLWIHGTADDFVNIGNGEIVYTNHGGVKQAVRVTGAGHSDIEPVMGYSNYLTTLHSFISANLP